MVVGAIPFIGSVPHYAIKDGIMHITVDGWAMCMALGTFKQGMAKAGRVIAEYEAHRAPVVPIKRGHAARS